MDDPPRRPVGGGTLLSVRPVQPAQVPVAQWDRPRLRSGVVRLRRSATSVQLGVSGPRAAVLHGVGPAEERLLDALDGTRDRGALEALATTAGMAPGALDRLLEVLAGHGLLDDAAARLSRAGLDDLDRARLAPDVAALGLLADVPDPDAAADQRRRAWVDVRGAGRVGAAVATLLAAAGVGRVTVLDPQPAADADRSPAGLGPGAAGTSREAAARQRVLETAPATRVARLGSRRRPGLVVLAPDDGPDAALAATWSRRQQPHLLAYVRENRGVVGPLVEPGVGACLLCLELHRRDRDPAWPRLAAQAGRSTAARACDVTLATVVAGQAAMHALAYLDRDRRPSAVTALRAASLETRLDDGRTRRRAWTPHPGCGCRWAQPVLAR